MILGNRFVFFFFNTSYNRASLTSNNVSDCINTPILNATDIDYCFNEHGYAAKQWIYMKFVTNDNLVPFEFNMWACFGLSVYQFYCLIQFMSRITQFDHYMGHNVHYTVSNHKYIYYFYLRNTVYRSINHKLNLILAKKKQFVCVKWT